MDITTSIGLIAGTIVIALMIFMGGDLHMFISEHAMIIIFGGSVISSFSWAMLVGVVVGTYSSIFIAAPVLIYLGLKIAGDEGGETAAAKTKAA